MVSKSERNKIIVILWCFATLMMLPSLLPATFLHESGHAIISLLLFRDNFVVINYLIGFYQGSELVVYWWQDFLICIMGIIISTIFMVISFKFLLPRVPSERIYTRLFVQIFTMGCWIMGPLYLVGALFLPFNDVTTPIQALNWYFGTISLTIPINWIFGLSGIILSIITMKYFAIYIYHDTISLLDQFFPSKFTNSIYKICSFLWIIFVLIIMLVYRVLATYLLQSTLSYSITNSWYMSFCDGIFLLEIFSTSGLIGFLGLIFFLNQRILWKISEKHAQINLKIFSIILLFLIPIFFTQEIIYRNPNLARMNNDLIDYNPPEFEIDEFWSYFSPTQGSPYVLTLYQNRSYVLSDGRSLYSYGLSLKKFDPILQKYSDSAFLLQNLTYFNQFDRINYVVDNNNRLWLFTIELINNMMQATPELKFHIISWQLSEQIFSNTSISPDYFIDLGFLNINITANFNFRLEYDEIHNSILLLFTNNTRSKEYESNITQNSNYVTKYYLTSLDLNSMSWSLPNELNSTIASSIFLYNRYFISTKFYFDSNNILSIYDVSFDRITFYQSESSNISGNWNKSEISRYNLENLNFFDWIVLENQVWLLFERERDLWLMIIHFDNATKPELTRITYDYIEYSGRFIRVIDRIFISTSNGLMFESSID